MRFGYTGNKHLERHEITDSPTAHRGDYPIGDYRVSKEGRKSSRYCGFNYLAEEREKPHELLVFLFLQ